MEREVKARLAANEDTFREVNEGIARGRWPGDPNAAIGFRCECARLGCNRLVELPLTAYEEVRAHPRRFLVEPGHELPEVETVVLRRGGYVVVEKRGEAGRARRTARPAVLSRLRAVTFETEAHPHLGAAARAVHDRERVARLRDQREPDPEAGAPGGRPQPVAVIADQDPQLGPGEARGERDLAAAVRVGVQDDVRQGLGGGEPDRVQLLGVGAETVGERDQLLTGNRN